MTETTPFTMVFTTSANANNPTQKDLTMEGSYLMASNKFLPSGDQGTLLNGLSQDPLLTDMACSCAGNTMTLTAYTLDTLALSGGNVVDTIDNVKFYYDDSGWQLIGTVTSPDTNTVNAWSVDWDTTGLSGSYNLRIVITDDQSNVTTDESWQADVDTCGLTALLVMLKSFNASRLGDSVLVEWETASEMGTVGFYLYRKDPSSGEYVAVNEKLIPGLLHSPQGGIYRLIDKKGCEDESCTYVLVEQDLKGRERAYGPLTVNIERGETIAGKETKLFYQRQKHLIYEREAHKVSDTNKARLLNKKNMKAIKPKRLGGNQIKIAVTETGIYYLDAREIASHLGLPYKHVKSLIKHNRLEMNNQGQQVPYLPAKRNSGIFFYGQGIESIYTRENVYWLRIGEGKKMSVIRGPRPAPAVCDETFTEILHAEQDRYPATALVSDPHADYWFWDYIVSGDAHLGSRQFTIRTDGAAITSETATLIVHLQGITDIDAVTDHHAVIYLNETLIGEGQWDGSRPFELTLTFSPNILTDGDNILEVRGLLDAGIPYSLFYIDSLDILYQRYYRAVNNTLTVRGEDNPVVTIEGFTDRKIFVFDITDPDNPKLITATTKDMVNGTYRVSLRPSSPEASYIALTSNRVRTPKSVIAYVPHHLELRTRGADYLVITPEELKKTAWKLAYYRQGQGLRTEVVVLEDIYDTFNYGIVNPGAIKDFLTYAYHHWANRPQYVVLVGNGTFDYKDNQGYGDNLLPPLMSSTPFGLFASDNKFADVVGNDGVPEIAIGRLPVLNAEELEEMINKIITYETASDGDWNRQFLMLADDPDDGGNFTAASEDIATIIPSEYTVEKIYLSELPINEARQLLMDGINNGATFLNYVGHGSFDRLSHEGLLLSNDISLFTNGEWLPVMITMTCLINRFDVPGFDALGEKLLLYNDGGAIAVWGPTGLAIYDELMILDRAFFWSLFNEGKTILGEGILKALESFYSSKGKADVISIYNLLGDPCLQLRF